MRKIKYKNRNNNLKRIIFILIVFLIFVVIILLALIYSIKNKSQEQLLHEDLKTIKDVISYYKCTYISEKESSEEGYIVDINLKFRYNLYNENDESNEKFFNDIINDLAIVINYENFKLIDSEKEIEIKVLCENNRVNKIIINNVEDYFIYMNSQMDLKKYEKIDEIRISIDSPILSDIVNKEWDKNIDFGSRDSIFNFYNIFFEEGINVRNISQKIYNIVFTKNYDGNVVNELYPGMDLKFIRAKLGEPAFKDEELNIIGYKSDNLYAFFSEDEISIYRISKDSMSDFFDLVDRFLQDELDLLEFMNNLTYIWPDYSDYEYTTNSVFISYPLKGLDVKINYDDISGIVIYNNINADMETVKEYLKNTEFVSRLKIDNVFEAEKRRIKDNIEFNNNCDEFYKKLDEDKKSIIGESTLFKFCPKIDNNGIIMGMKFLSKNGENPNREISDYIDTYLWMNDEIFIYSKEKKGIYYYNVISGKIGSLITGTEEYKIKEYKNGILKYDDTEIIIQY